MAEVPCIKTSAPKEVINLTERFEAETFSVGL